MAYSTGYASFARKRLQVETASTYTAGARGLWSLTVGPPGPLVRFDPVHARAYSWQSGGGAPAELAGERWRRLRSRGHRCVQEGEAVRPVLSVVAGMDGVAGDEVLGGRRRRTKRGLRLGCDSSGVEVGDGSVDAQGWFWCRK